MMNGEKPNNFILRLVTHIVPLYSSFMKETSDLLNKEEERREEISGCSLLSCYGGNSKRKVKRKLY